MVLSEYAKIRILTLWRENNGPTAIVKSLEQENISTTRKTVTFFLLPGECDAYRQGLLMFTYTALFLTSM